MPKPQQTDQPCAGFVFLVDIWRACDTFRIRLTNEVEEMNKQELIDKAVHDLKGKSPDTESEDTVIFGDEYVLLCTESIKDDGSCWLKGRYYLGGKECDASFDSICLLEEFQQRARELGYINGFRWGVEYPTNGEKPDLPDDVVTTIKDHNDVWETSCDEPVDNWYWSCASAFKITDQRYKPADTSYLNALSQDQALTHSGESLTHSYWYDYEAQKAVALPPVGTKCQVWIDNVFTNCTVIHHANNSVQDVAAFKVAQVKGSDVGNLGWSVDFRPLDHNRKAEAEKNNTIAEVCRACITLVPQTPRQILELAYDKGFLRMPAE